MTASRPAYARRSGTETAAVIPPPSAGSFGPERYDRTRLRYPEALVARIAATSPGTDVLDVGCGTGIAARQFQQAGCRVLGVEPDARMAEFARRSGVETEVAKFEDWDCAGRRFDAVVAGQAWHWIDPTGGAALAAKVLRPGGRLAVFWYVFQPPADVAEAFCAVYRQVLPDVPGSGGPLPDLAVYSSHFTEAADGMRQAGVFDEPEQWRFDFDRTHTRDDWLEMVPTFSGHSSYSQAQQEELLEGMGAAIDAKGGSFSTGYAAAVVTATRMS